MTCEVCGAPTGWVHGHSLESANESKRCAMADAKEAKRKLGLAVEALRIYSNAALVKELGALPNAAAETIAQIEAAK